MIRKDVCQLLLPHAENCVHLLAHGPVNLSGVVHDFSAACNALWWAAILEDKGTDYVNQHAISTIFVTVIARVNRGEEPHSETTLQLAESICREIIKGA
jgi:hypothetical protein